MSAPIAFRHVCVQKALQKSNSNRVNWQLAYHSVKFPTGTAGANNDGFDWPEFTDEPDRCFGIADGHLDGHISGEQHR